MYMTRTRAMRRRIARFSGLEARILLEANQAARHSNEKSWRPGSSRWWAFSWQRRSALVGKSRRPQQHPLSARADFCRWITRHVSSWIYLSPTQRQPRAGTTAPTSGSSVRTASAEAAPRLSSLSAASADHSFMASCLQQRDASTVARRLLSARLTGGGPKAWVVVIKVGGPLLARLVTLGA